MIRWQIVVDKRETFCGKGLKGGHNGGRIEAKANKSK